MVTLEMEHILKNRKQNVNSFIDLVICGGLVEAVGETHQDGITSLQPLGVGTVCPCVRV